jgi:zinc finger SWIM domain-containing protein 3
VAYGGLTGFLKIEEPFEIRFWHCSFLKHFERTVQEKRGKELESEFESRKKLPIRQMCTPMLVQASQVYTPIISEAFQSEYERSMAACARVLDGDNKYAITIGSLHGDLSFE